MSVIHTHPHRRPPHVGRRTSPFAYLNAFDPDTTAVAGLKARYRIERGTATARRISDATAREVRRRAFSLDSIAAA
jgi:hypothetical protein